MRIKTLLEKLRRPAPRPMATDWTNGWTLRDLADLPSQHRRRDDR